MSVQSDSPVLFLGKEGDPGCARALEFLRRNFDPVEARLGRWGEPFPRELVSWHGDYLISYLSRWVVPATLIKAAKAAAINFHPAPPQYPGIGCTNFALYEEAREYGATCHYMAPKVDEGAVIAVKRFPVFPSDDVKSLLARTYEFQLILFYEIMGRILNREELPRSDEKWTRRPFTREELNDLARITPEMDREEIRKRVRAATFGPWRPTVEISGHVFQLKTAGDEES